MLTSTLQCDDHRYTSVSVAVKTVVASGVPQGRASDWADGCTLGYRTALSGYCYVWMSLDTCLDRRLRTLVLATTRLQSDDDLDRVSSSVGGLDRTLAFASAR